MQSWHQLTQFLLAGMHVAQGAVHVVMHVEQGASSAFDESEGQATAREKYLMKPRL